jgi:hypothetical protein
MTTDELATALRACAAGLYPLEAGVALLTAEGTFIRRDDFTGRFIEHGTSISDDTTPMAAIDWDAAVTALHAGEIPCSGGERRILMLSASLAGGIPSTSATQPPASMTATSSDWSPRSCTRRGNDPTRTIDDHL